MTSDTNTHLTGESPEEILARRAEELALRTVEEEASDLISILLFRIGEETYAVDVADVREIFQEYEITRIPCTPECVLGVTNVRGEILSVTDPALMMSLGRIVGDPGHAEQPPAIVVKNMDVATALVVDAIGDIVEVPSNAIEPPVSVIDRAQSAFIAGTLFVDGGMVGLLNVERVLEPVGAHARH